MLIKDSAFVLSRIDFRESSLISKILTKEHGMISSISKGVRSSGAKGRSHILEPGNKIEIELDMKPMKNLQFLQKFSFVDNISAHSISPLRNSMFFYFLEILPKFILEGEEASEFYELLDSYQKEVIACSKNELIRLPLSFSLDIVELAGFPISPWMADHNLHRNDFESDQFENRDKLLDSFLNYINNNYISIGKVKSLKVLRDIVKFSR